MCELSSDLPEREWRVLHRIDEGEGAFTAGLKLHHAPAVSAVVSSS